MPGRKSETGLELRFGGGLAKTMLGGSFTGIIVLFKINFPGR
jgi:hypothetical protein